MLNFKLENISDSFKKNYQNILKNMERKIEVKTLEKIFERFIEREREFFDFQVLKEEKFMEKYYNFYY
jgi:type III secretory pathway component EscV